MLKIAFASSDDADTWLLVLFIISGVWILGHGIYLAGTRSQSENTWEFNLMRVVYPDSLVVMACS
jgi:hypothetical protein